MELYIIKPLSIILQMLAKKNFHNFEDIVSICIDQETTALLNWILDNVGIMLKIKQEYNVRCVALYHV
jgi:hypothetical protein